MACSLAEQALKRLSTAIEDPGAVLDGATLGRLLALTTAATEQLKALCSASAQQVLVEEMAGGLVLEDLARDALEELAGGDLLRSVLQHVSVQDASRLRAVNHRCWSITEGTQLGILVRLVRRLWFFLARPPRSMAEICNLLRDLTLQAKDTPHDVLMQLRDSSHVTNLFFNKLIPKLDPRSCLPCWCGYCDGTQCDGYRDLNEYIHPFFAALAAMAALRFLEETGLPKHAPSIHVLFMLFDECISRDMIVPVRVRSLGQGYCMPALTFCLSTEYATYIMTEVKCTAIVLPSLSQVESRMGTIKETMMPRGVAACVADVFENKYPVSSAIVLEAMLFEAETDTALYEPFYEQYDAGRAETAVTHRFRDRFGHPHLVAAPVIKYSDNTGFSMPLVGYRLSPYHLGDGAAGFGAEPYSEEYGHAAGLGRLGWLWSAVAAAHEEELERTGTALSPAVSKDILRQQFGC